MPTVGASKSGVPAELLARAFQEDPFFRWAERNPRRRPRLLKTVFAGMLELAAQDGGALIEPGVGAVEWRPSDRLQLSAWAILKSGLWRVGLEVPPSVWLRLNAHEASAMARVRAFLSPGSAYLESLGVEPALAGQGYGGRLLDQALAEMGRQWTSCVLRTEQPRNVAFYQRHGFELVDELVVAASGLRVWIFSRSLEVWKEPLREGGGSHA